MAKEENRLKGTKKYLLGLCGLCLVAMLALSGCTAKPETAETVETDTHEEGITHEPELAPMFTLKDMANQDVNLSDYKGQYVMVNFWATWCQYCDEEMPDLVAFQEKHKDEVTVLAINVKEEPEEIADYLKKKGINLKVLQDSDGKVAEEFLVGSLPSTFLIDRAGYVIGYIPGKMTLEDMEGSFKYLQEQDTTK